MDASGAGADDRGSATCIPPPPSPSVIFFISYTHNIQIERMFTNGSTCS